MLKGIAEVKTLLGYSTNDEVHHMHVHVLQYVITLLFVPVTEARHDSTVNATGGEGHPFRLSDF